MYHVLHWVIVTLFSVVPVASFASAMVRKRRRGAFVQTLMTGAVLGVGINLIYAYMMQGRVMVTQVALAIYFATGLMLILKSIDRLVRHAISATVLRPPKRRGVEALPPVRRRARPMRVLAAVGIRLAVLGGFVMPYAMVAVLTYRPKVNAATDPREMLGWNYQPVSFDTSDGVRIAGFFIPAIGEASDRTVIVCHGLASNKSNQLILARGLVPGGYNVLTIDLRAHGDSGGQLTTFGLNESRDILAAASYLKAQRPGQAVHVFGVGASMGAAALITAAADDSPAGRAIEAVAVVGTFDSTAGLFRTILRQNFLEPIRSILGVVALPMASAQVGEDLRAFEPATLAPKIWPRPILVVHGTKDEIISFEHGRRLFDLATQPKQRLWIVDATHNNVIDDETVARAIKAFFDAARGVPVI